MKLFKMCGHNPKSESAKRRKEKREALTVGVCKCDKCGTIRGTFIKIKEDPATYRCVDCAKVDKK